MALNGDPTAGINVSMNNLNTTDFALPQLWDARFKQLLDNDATLNKTLTDILTGKAAVRKLQGLSTVAALRAFTGMQDGETSYLKGAGLYRYYAEATDAENLPWVVLPTANGAPTPVAGRWHLDMVPAQLLGANGGVATLTSEGFLAQVLPAKTLSAGQVQDDTLTDKQFANVTIDSTSQPTGDTAKPGALLSALAWVITNITGKASWRSKPDVSLATLASNAARLDKPGTFKQNMVFQNSFRSTEIVITNGYGDELYLGGDNAGNDYELRLQKSARPLTIWSGDGPITVNVVGTLNASNGVAQSSLRALKRDIHPYVQDALDVLRRTQVVTYRYRAMDEDRLHIGFIADDTPQELSGEERDKMLIDNALGVLIRATQQLDERLQALEVRQ